MVKEVLMFMEMANTTFPLEAARKAGYSNLLFPNTFFDAAKGAELYNMYFDEYQYASEIGWDGAMTNEHHYAPSCMQVSTDIIAATLIQRMKKGRIALLGNPLPISDNPVRIAEEVAMLDLISGGRITSGFVRGTGVESLAGNVNPAYNMERLDEAHDLIVKTWTTPGPFRWEGKHFNLRVVNPWVLPLQKPHPPIWIPGASRDAVAWAATRRYPYICLTIDLETTIAIRRIYDQVAADCGYEAKAEHFGAVINVTVQDTDEKAYEEGKHFQWQQRGTFAGPGTDHWATPPGYSRRAVRTGVRGQRTSARTAAIQGSDYDAKVKNLGMVVGSPQTVIEKLKMIVDKTDPAWLILRPREGDMSHAAAQRSIELCGKEVIPAMKAYRSQYQPSPK